MEHSRPAVPFIVFSSLFGHAPQVLVVIGVSYLSQMSRPTDSWITDLRETLAATASSPLISTSGSTTARFVSVGSRMIPDPLTMSGSGGVPDGEYDGGTKRAHLFLFNAAVQQEERVCLGFVGQENHRFCLRPATIHDPTSGKVLRRAASSGSVRSCF
jgi:hypothetical protein